MAVVTLTCAGCGSDFEAKTPRAKWCGATCRQRAARAKRAADSHEVEESKVDTPAEHGLVKAVRLELGKAKKVDTFAGQLALQIARRLANPDESGVMAMSKELRSVMAEALGTTPPEPEKTGGADAHSDGAGAEEEDDVTRARRQREEARKAAGLA